MKTRAILLAEQVILTLCEVYLTRLYEGLRVCEACLTVAGVSLRGRGVNLRHAGASLADGDESLSAPGVNLGGANEYLISCKTTMKQ